MANTPKKHPSGRRRKQTKTIDLEANPVADETVETAENVAEAVEAEMAAGDKADVQDAGGETDTITEPTDDGPESGTPEEGADKPAARSGGGASIGSMLISGLVGGAVVLGGAGIMNTTGNLQNVPVIGGLFGSSGGSGNLEAANAKIAELSTRLDELSARPGSADLAGDITALSEKLSALETNIAEAGDSGSAASSETAQKALEAAQVASQKADDTAAKIAELSGKIVESGGGTNIDMDAVKAALSGESEALANRIAAVENQLKESTSATGSAELDAIREQLAGFQQLGDSVSALDSKAEVMATGLKEASQTIDSIVERLGTIESSVNEKILPSMTEVQNAASAAVESQKVARSVSARALGNVLEQGGKFTSELAAAEALAGGSEAITQLKPLAESGIFTDAELLTGFETVSDNILASEASDTSEGGILDKFMASAKTLVQVRPSGPVSGDSTVAVLSRIGASLKSGDLAAVKTEWESLNDSAKSTSTDWIKSVDDRMKAKTLIETVIGELSADQNGQG